jgi:hypothetical protein
LEVVQRADVAVERAVQRGEMRLQALARKAEDQVGRRSQSAAAHVHLRLPVGLEFECRALHVAKHVLVERLHGLVQHERAAHLLERLDDPVRLVLAGGCIDERGPSVGALHLADEARDLNVALDRAVVRVGDAQCSHRRRLGLDHLRDVADLFLHPLDREIVQLRIPLRALRAERAPKRAAAVGLDHRRELAVEELVLNTGQPGRGYFVDLLVTCPGFIAHRVPIAIAVQRRWDRHPPKALLGQKELDVLGGEKITLAEHVRVDLAAVVEPRDLALRFERDIRASHDHQRVGLHALRRMT